MPKIVTSIDIEAPIERVFDLSRSIDFHAFSQSHRNEVAISGRTSGLINAGETVTWSATHLGLSQKLAVVITHYDKPYTFRDTMLKGAFRRFDHDHIFEQVNGKVKVTDVFDFESPFSFIGKLFDLIVLEKYMRKFSNERNAALKKALESEGWREFLNK